MEYQQNITPDTYQSEKQQQGFIEQNPMPPKWLNVVFKTWAILNFLAIVGIFITITVSLKSNLKIISQLTEISISYSLILYGLYGAVFVLLLVYLILFWGSFKLRKWALPILIVLFLFSAINTIALLFRPLQFSIFDIVINLIIIAIALLGFIFRNYFTGTYRKLSLQITFFIFIVPVLSIGTLTLLFPDLEKVSDSDLIQNNFLSVSKDQNAYYILSGIINQAYEPTGQANDRYKQFIESKIWDQTEVDAILNKNVNVLNETRRAAALSYYQCPSYENGLSLATALCLAINNYLRIARIASLSALSKAQKGDFQGSIDDALMPVRIGQLIKDEPVVYSLVDYLFGDAMQRIGLNTIQVILTKYQVPSEILLARITELQKYTQNEKGLKNSFRLEYQSWKNSLAFVNKINSNFYIQPNRFFSDMADDTRQKMALTDTPCYQLETTLEQYQKNFEEKITKIAYWKLPFTRNALFEVLKSAILVNSSSIQNKRCESDLLVEQTMLQMALSAYKNDKGQFPSFQSELVPNYLSREILNPYTNRAFIFNKDTGVIDQKKK